MKTDTHTREVTRVGVGQESAFKIKASAKAFKILSDGLYTDKVLAVIRELSSNAWDAHIAAGTTDKPFEVHLPNAIEPWFHIRDFGIGLSHDDVMNLYTTYFDSTKTDSNEFTGALGLGSKSPFSYVDSFTVTSFYNGEKRVYMIDIGSEGIPNVALVEGFPQPTDEPNGLLIKMAAKQVDFNDFVVKARQIYRRYPVVPTIVGYHNFVLDKIEYELVGKNWRICKPSSGYHYSSNKSYAIQGTVAYPIEPNAIQGIDYQKRQLLSSISLEIDFGIGDLDITASREGLGYDERTSSNLIRRIDEAINEISRLVEKEFTSCKCAWDAHIKYQEYFNRRNNSTLQTLLRNGFLKPTWRNVDLSQGMYGIDLGTKKFHFLGYNEGDHVSHRVARRYAHGMSDRKVLKIVPSNNITFALDDLDTGGVNRFKYWVEQASTPVNHRYFLVRQYPIDDPTNTPSNTPTLKAIEEGIRRSLGMRPATDKIKFIRTSEMPKSPVTPRVKGVTDDSKANMMKRKWHWGYSQADKWTKGEVDLTTGGVYISTDRYQTDYDGLNSYNLSPDDIIGYAKTFSLIPDSDPDVYGAGKMARGKIEKYNKGAKSGKKWKDLKEMICRYLNKSATQDAYVKAKQMLSSHEQVMRQARQFAHGTGSSETLLVIGKLLRDDNRNNLLTRFHESFGSMHVNFDTHEYEKACRSFNIPLPKYDDDQSKVDGIIKDIHARYPMLRVVTNIRHLPITDQFIVLDYVKAIDDNNP